MKPTNPLNNHLVAGRHATAAALLSVLALSAMLAASARAGSAPPMYRIPTNSPGGVPAQSTITSFTPAGTNTSVCWYGMQGWYTIEMTTNLSTWTPVGRVPASSFATCALVPNGGNPGANFRLNQTNAFAGSGACAGCHGDKYGEWKGTRHSDAYNTIASLPLPPAVKQTCYPCHTVGMNQPTGFLNITNTPYLTDVGCENCHGPAAWHKYSDHDLIRPAVSIDPAICGGCHTDDHHPTYEEYEGTLHSEVNDDVKYGFNGGTYYPGTLVVRGANSTSGVIVVTNGAPGSTNCYGYYVTTNANLTLKTNYTTGIVHSGNGAGTGYIYDPGQDRAVGCGICHSAATRMAMIQDYEARQDGRTNALVFPAAQDSGAWSAACATCHDPHSAENIAQLRNPIWSTNYYTMPTTADKRTIYTTNFQGAITTNIIFMSAAFANMYDPDVQICGQCHNSRGARWDGRSFGYYNATTLLSVTTNGPGIVWGVQTNISYSRPPHHSPQYNILSGIAQPDYLNGTSNVFGVHSLNTNGCAACHMKSVSVASPTPENPNYTGHEFEPLLTGANAYVSCAVSGCHSSTTQASNDMFAVQFEISGAISTAVSNLNNWATTKGPALFGTNYSKYLQNGWEYTTPGALATITNAGPSSSDQLKIPVGVRQARFNLYMVNYGNAASLGVHNPTYTRYLLNDCSNKVWQASQ